MKTAVIIGQLIMIVTLIICLIVNQRVIDIQKETIRSTITAYDTMTETMTIYKNSFEKCRDGYIEKLME
jgi:hypothetical protein